MADTHETKRIPLMIGEREFEFHELTIEDIEAVSLGLRRMYLETAKVHIEVMADSKAEKEKLRKEMLEVAFGITMHTELGSTLISSVDGMQLLLWVSTCRKDLTFLEFKQLILEAKPKDIPLEEYKKQVGREVVELYTAANIGDDVSNPGQLATSKG